MKPGILLGLAFLLVGSCGIYAQTTIIGKLFGDNDMPIENASVMLLRVKDSSLVKGAVSDHQGLFSINSIGAGQYFLQCSHTSYEDIMTAGFTLNADNATRDIGMVRMKPAGGQLSNVTVTAKKKPLFEQQIDRMVVNVKSSPTSAGNTVLEVLERSPGVSVDRANGGISLNGKGGIAVMINGRMNYMPADALVQMLNSMNASNVERIELITVPPSKYDAGGSAGYINIVLIDNPNEGFNGNYSLGYAYGKGDNPSAGTNFNYRKKNINLFGTYSFSRASQLQEGENYRKVTTGNNVDEVFIKTERDPTTPSHNARLGLDINTGKRTILGLLVSGYHTNWQMDALNHANYSTNGITDTTITITTEEVNLKRQLASSVNLVHKFTDKDELSFTADYSYNDFSNPTYYFNEYYDGQGNPLAKENTLSSKESVFHIWAAQADYDKKMENGAALQAGVKWLNSTFTNDLLVASEKQGVWVPDPKYTDNFDWFEKVAAAYVSGSFNLSERTAVSGGLRYEYTITNLSSDTEKDIVDRKYGNLFPTLYVAHKLHEQQSLNLSYSRRITRPSFQVLAPFLIFIDPKTSYTGNPAVQPAISDAVQLSYVVKKLALTTSYTYTNNFIAGFMPQTNPVDNSQTVTSQNMDYMKTVNLNATLPITITKWWQSNINFGFNWSEVAGLYNKTEMSVSQYYYTINGSEVITLPQRFTFEVSGFYTSKSIMWGGMLTKPFGQLNLALQKKFGKRNNTLTIGADNILNTMKFSSELDLPDEGIYNSGVINFWPATVKINWVQNFGNKALKDKRNRKTASDEVQSRF